MKMFMKHYIGIQFNIASLNCFLNSIEKHNRDDKNVATSTTMRKQKAFCEESIARHSNHGPFSQSLRNSPNIDWWR